MRRFRWAGLLALLPVLYLAVSWCAAQPPAPFNERSVKRERNAQDKDDIWVLDFRFKDPRLITVDVPGMKGRKVVMYLWYQVINNTGEPRTLIPDFELVTHDKPAVYHDQVLPKVQEAIQRVEDPTKHLDIKNSVTIANEPIPPTKPNAFPRAVTGVATWVDVNPDANHFSVFVSGLSNGWSEDDSKVVRRKTLKLKFRRVGDRYFPDSREIKFVPPEEWLYRATAFSTADLDIKPKDAEPKNDKNNLGVLTPQLPVKQH